MGAKVVYNSDFGGFSLSGKAIRYFMELKGKTIFAYREGKGNIYQKIENPTDEDLDAWDVATFDKDFGKSFNNYESEHDDHYVSGYISTGDYPRHDPELVKTVEDLGRKANGSHAHLRIKELKGNRYIIDEYDGYERVVEPDDIKWITVEE